MVLMRQEVKSLSAALSQPIKGDKSHPIRHFSFLFVLLLASIFLFLCGSCTHCEACLCRFASRSSTKQKGSQHIYTLTEHILSEV